LLPKIVNNIYNLPLVIYHLCLRNKLKFISSDKRGHAKGKKVLATLEIIHGNKLLRDIFTVLLIQFHYFNSLFHIVDTQDIGTIYQCQHI